MLAPHLAWVGSFSSCILAIRQVLPFPQDEFNKLHNEIAAFLQEEGADSGEEEETQHAPRARQVLAVRLATKCACQLHTRAATHHARLLGF